MNTLSQRENVAPLSLISVKAAPLQIDKSILLADNLSGNYGERALNERRPRIRKKGIDGRKAERKEATDPGFRNDVV